LCCIRDGSKSTSDSSTGNVAISYANDALKADVSEILPVLIIRIDVIKLITR
jgi:hypothetical protein